MAPIASNSAWDPRKTLDVYPYTSSFTCVGKARSKDNNPRCGWIIPQHNRDYAERMFCLMEKLDPNSRQIGGYLENLARLLLCEIHQSKKYSQTDEKLYEWSGKIKYSIKRHEVETRLQLRIQNLEKELEELKRLHTNENLILNVKLESSKSQFKKLTSQVVEDLQTQLTDSEALYRSKNKEQIELTEQNGVARRDLEFAQNELGCIRVEMGLTYEELGLAQEELELTQGKLESAQVDLQHIRGDMEGTKGVLKVTQEGLERIQQDFKCSQEKLQCTQEELQRTQEESQRNQKELDQEVLLKKKFEMENSDLRTQLAASEENIRLHVDSEARLALEIRTLNIRSEVLEQHQRRIDDELQEPDGPFSGGRGTENAPETDKDSLSETQRSEGSDDSQIRRISLITQLKQQRQSSEANRALLSEQIEALATKLREAGLQIASCNEGRVSTPPYENRIADGSFQSHEPPSKHPAPPSLSGLHQGSSGQRGGQTVCAVSKGARAHIERTCSCAMIYFYV